MNWETPTSVLTNALQRVGFQARCRILSIRGEHIVHVILRNNKQTDIRLLRVVERVIVEEIEEKTGTCINQVFWSYRRKKERSSRLFTEGPSRPSQASPEVFFASTSDEQTLMSFIRDDHEDDELEVYGDVDLDRWETEIREEISKTRIRTEKV